jgi:hypothetical protein
VICPEGGYRAQPRVSNAPELHTQFVGGKSASSDLADARIHSPVAIFVPLEAPLNGANGTQAGSLCYINVVASSLQLHGDSSRDGSGRSLDSPEGQWSIGFQPVFCSHERCSTLLVRLPPPSA